MRNRVIAFIWFLAYKIIIWKQLSYQNDMIMIWQVHTHTNNIKLHVVSCKAPHSNKNNNNQERRMSLILCKTLRLNLQALTIIMFTTYIFKINNIICYYIYYMKLTPKLLLKYGYQFHFNVQDFTRIVAIALKTRNAYNSRLLKSTFKLHSYCKSRKKSSIYIRSKFPHFF